MLCELQIIVFYEEFFFVPSGSFVVISFGHSADHDV